jgi:glycosyltransferase involved in cell wall biosynthesis
MSRINKTVCFFINTKDKSIIERIEFYKIDIEILRDLGFEIKFCFSWKRIPKDVDFYFIWWWTYAFFPAVIGAMINKPVIITGTFNLVKNVLFPSFYNRPFYERFLIRASAKIADANITVSNYEYNKFRKEISSDNVFHSPHVLKFEKYDLIPKFKRENFIFTIAQMSKESTKRKCIPEILQTAVLIKQSNIDIRFLIAGEIRDDASYIKEMYSDLDLRQHLEFIGLISEAKKIEMLKKCKIYLQPSTFEGFGLAIAEAMLCRAPVITSCVGAVPEITGSFCTYVDGKNPKDIFAKIKYVLDNYSDRHILAIDGEKWIRENFNYNRRKLDFGKIFQKFGLLS